MKTYRRMLHLCSLMYMMYHILEPTHISASENSSIHICCAISVMSSTSLLSLVSQWLPLDLRERWKKKKKKRHSRQETNHTSVSPKIPAMCENTFSPRRGKRQNFPTKLPPPLLYFLISPPSPLPSDYLQGCAVTLHHLRLVTTVGAIMSPCMCACEPMC